MKNTLLLGVALLAGSFALNAASLTPEQSLQRALDSHPSRALLASHQRAALKLVKSSRQVYVFSNGSGFLVTPADDVAYPVLGYADSGEFSENPELSYWFDFYSRQIEAYKNLPADNVDEPIVDFAPIAPLTKTRWNQEQPYNDLCPELNGTRCVTGCVATAMAQVLKYHGYPAKGTGTHSYDWQAGNQTLGFDYGAQDWDWNLMTNTYNSSSSTASKNAVATLMYACGVSVDMSYDPNDSGAISRKMITSFINYFNYDKGAWMPERDYYGLKEWQKMVYDELAAGRPVLYAGQGSAGGHQFICDGYEGNGYFHFNWGWGGLSDGYFQLTALDPPALGVGGGAGGFNYDQEIALGVQAPQADSDYHYVLYCTEGFEPGQQTANAGDELEFGQDFYNFSFATLPTGSAAGIEISSSDGSQKQYVSGDDLSGLTSLEGFSYLTVTLPQLPDGNYVITPAFKVNGNWQPIRTSLSTNQSVSAQVQGGVYTFSTPEQPQLTVDNVVLNSDLYVGCEFSMTFDLNNQGATEYVGTVVPVLISTDGSTLVAEADTYPVDLLAGESSTAGFYGKFAGVNQQGYSSTLAAGTYLLGIVDSTTGQLVSGTQTVTVNAQPAQTSVGVTSLRLVQGTQLSSPSVVTFEANVECEEGYFASPVQIVIFRSTGGTSLLNKASDPVFLSGGQNKTVKVDLDITSLTDGNYMAAVYASNQQISNPLAFSINDHLVGVDGLESDAADSLIYSVDGFRLNHIPAKGLYIKEGKLIFRR